MKNKKNILLIVATVILVAAAVLCFTVFNKSEGNNSSGGGSKKTEFDYNNLLNMVPMVQRANSGLYPYGNFLITDRSVEEKVIGALNHYEYVNCNSESTINNCDTIEVDKIISEIKSIYGLDITKGDIDETKITEFYVHATGYAFQSYKYENGLFSVDGEKGFVNRNNEIIKKEKNNDECIIYERVYYLGLDYKDDETYEVIYNDHDYSKEVAREKFTYEDGKKEGGLDLSKYSDYGVTFIHTFKNDGNGNYKYVSSKVEGLSE